MCGIYLLLYLTADLTVTSKALRRTSSNSGNRSLIWEYVALPQGGFSGSDDMGRVCCNMDVLCASPFTAAGCFSCWWSVKFVCNYQSVSAFPREDGEWWELGCGLAVPLSGDGHMVWERGCLEGVSQQMFYCILVAKSFKCQLAPVR